MIALTFDDGPNEPYTRQILDVLAEYGAKATFFVIGKWVRKAPEIVREIASAGHEVGNHSETHPQMGQLSQDECLAEWGACDRALLDAFSYNPYQQLRQQLRLGPHRCPFGDVPAHHPLGWHTSWDIHGGDWAAESVESITEPIFKYLDAHKGGIVLLHDGYYKEFGADRSKTVEATRRILERYKGEKFVTIEEYQQCLTHCA